MAAVVFWNPVKWNLLPISCYTLVLQLQEAGDNLLVLTSEIQGYRNIVFNLVQIYSFCLASVGRRALIHLCFLHNLYFA